MTGFAHTQGTSGGLSWVWELRSLNSRGLDLRFRLPLGWDSLEPGLREAAGKALRRGSVSIVLRLKRENQSRIVVDEVALENALTLALALHKRIPGSLAPRAETLLGLPGVLRPAETEEAAETTAVAQNFARALQALVEARQAEGARLAAILKTLLGEVADLHRRAVAEAAHQPEAQRMRMMENLTALLSEAPSLPEERLTQEVALLAVRFDVREELDRLASHIEAAHALLCEGANVGRRFDFLVQEFNREANTLCSKSASTALTATGLKLKATVDQLREQVQNIE